MAVTEAALLREVAKVQRDKTIQQVRDLIDRVPTTKPGRSYSPDKRTAEEFRDELVRLIQNMKEE